MNVITMTDGQMDRTSHGNKTVSTIPVRSLHPLTVSMVTSGQMSLFLIIFDPIFQLSI